MTDKMEDEFNECDDVDTSDVNHNSWIVKVPRGLFEEWNKSSQNGAIPVGDVRLVNEKIDGSKEEGTTTMKIVSRNVEYTMEPQQIPKPLYVFKKESNQMAVNSAVRRLFHLRRTTPVTEKDYTERIRKITKMKNERMNKMQVHNQHDRGLLSRAPRSKLKDLGKKKRKIIRDKMDKQTLINLLLLMFTRKIRWKFDEIVKETKQSPRYVREVLDEVATKHLSGVHRSLWEMKSEYKTSNEEEEGGDGKKEEKDEWED